MSFSSYLIEKRTYLLLPILLRRRIRRARQIGILNTVYCKVEVLTELEMNLQAAPEVVEKAVETALAAGYRLIDTAFNYGNEEAIGRAIKAWIAAGGKREQLFITTKVRYYLDEGQKILYRQISG